MKTKLCTIGLICIAFSCTIVLCGCVMGSKVVTGQARPPVSMETVQVYPTMPADAEVVGIVTANSTASFSWDTAKQQCLVKLRKEAGEIGANGIVVISVDDSVWEGQKMQASAVFVPEKKR